MGASALYFCGGRDDPVTFSGMTALAGMARRSVFSLLSTIGNRFSMAGTGTVSLIVLNCVARMGDVHPLLIAGLLCCRVLTVERFIIVAGGQAK